MCIGFGQFDLNFNYVPNKSDDAVLERFYNLQTELHKNAPKNLRIKLWSNALILKQETPLKASFSKFGWIEKKPDGKTWPVFNTRVEGGWNNKSNDVNYSGNYDLYKNPYVKDHIQNHRCIVPCDYFIEQPTDKKIKKKYLLRREDKQALFLAGIHNNQNHNGFTLLTTVSTKIATSIAHERSPLLLDVESAFHYLNSNNSIQDLEQFYNPNNKINMIAYEIDPIIAKQNCPLANDDLRLIEPLRSLF
jgi:putative SOS response-associated peptidase YedK